jgi:hypothetical protein
VASQLPTHNLLAPNRFLSLLLLVPLTLAACQGKSASPSQPDMTSTMHEQDMCPPTGGTPHSITATVALTEDGQGVPFGTQNGSVIHVAKADIVGKSYYWATAKGGEPITNAKMIDVGTGMIDNNLGATITTPAHYPDGPWEFAIFISLTGGSFAAGPQPGDLAGFDLSPPPACQPPVTGVSIRVTIAGADASINLGNRSFIRF